MKKLIAMALMGTIFLNIALADFGQTTGILDFGELDLYENNTLSYWLINTGNETAVFEIVHPDDVFIKPAEGTIRPRGQQLIEVTAVAESVGEHRGSITARLIGNATGTVVFRIQLEKNFKFEVVGSEETGTGNANLDGDSKQNNIRTTLLISIISSLGLFLALSFLYLRMRDKKTEVKNR